MNKDLELEKTKCITCKYFESYRDAYFGDEFEPEDEGFCSGSDDNNSHTFSDSDSCKFYMASINYDKL